jgi:hypothetical protein
MSNKRPCQISASFSKIENRQILGGAYFSKGLSSNFRGRLFYKEKTFEIC